MARLDVPAGVSDGLHLALSEFQGLQPDQTSFPADVRGDGNSDLPGLEFLATHAFGFERLLCRQRYSASRGWDLPPASASTSGASQSGAPSWLTFSNTRW